MTAAAALVAAGLALSACSNPVAVSDEAAPDAGIQLFQLPWTAIADECEQNLGPDGFAWVLTSPPQEHIVGEQWWVSYQPVSYEIESRLGTRDEFADMVDRCAAVDVEVVADAVINHMSGQDAPGTGWAGSSYEHYAYPGLYEEGDFHHCGLTPDDDIADYGSLEQVQTCELVNLADLDTASTGVRGRIVTYLQDLLSLGVAGFRIDAAKHMAADDVAAIVAELPEGTRILSEVIRGAGEPVQPEDYTAFGEVFEFTYARDLAPGLESGLILDPELSDVRTMHVPSEKAIVFVDNHDTERGEAVITVDDGPLYAIANVLMLADDYGTPVVYSGYRFDDRDAGAPTEADGTVRPDVCDGSIAAPDDVLAAGDRTCVQTWTSIGGMLEWRRFAGDAARMPGVDEGDAYGFEREGRAVVAVNPGDEAVEITVPTSLAAGEYCDVIAAGPGVGEECPADARIRVTDGAASFTLAPLTASAIHAGRPA